MVRDTIKNNPDEYGIIIDRPFDEYLQWIMKEESWGGGIELYILAKLLQAEIYVITIESLSYNIFGQDGGYKQRIYLLYTGIHYDIITRNAFDECPEAEDQRVFDPTDKLAEDGALFIANEQRKQQKFVNLNKCAFVWTVCNTPLATMEELREHAKETGHQNFMQASEFQR